MNGVDDIPKNRNQLHPGLSSRKSSYVSETESEFEVRNKIIRSGSRKMAMWAMFSDFTENSTLHGVKYLGKRKRHWIERAFWVIAVLTSFIVCSYMIHKIYIRWQKAPVIGSFAQKSTPMYKIPFPAVTICPVTKATSKFVNFTDNYNLIYGSVSSKSLTDDARMRMAALSQVCDSHLLKGVNLNSSTNPREYIKLIAEMAVPYDETILFCKYRHISLRCSEIFTEVITEEGICYTFNMLNGQELFRSEMIKSGFHSWNHNSSLTYRTLNEEFEEQEIDIDDMYYFDPDMLNVNHDKISTTWTLEEGYKTNSTYTYPRRILDSGDRAGLVVGLVANERDFDYICRDDVQGFKIILHTPGDIPRASKQFFRVPINQEVIVSVKPQMMITDEEIYGHAPERRQCYFNSERYLRFFKVYTQNNCEVECLTNLTLKECKCVKFSMPRENKTNICGPADVHCYSKVEKKNMLVNLEEGIGNYVKKEKRIEGECDCLPSCTSIQYDAEISQADLNWKNVLKALKLNVSEIPGLHISRLTIFFKDSQLITSIRSELYGKTEFFANCGGLLGLFMGFSVLSLIEIIYYLTIRLACNLNLRRLKREKIRRWTTIKRLNLIPDVKINEID